MPLRDQAGMHEHVDRDGVGLGGDVDVGGPAAEGLVEGEGGGEDLPVDVGEEVGFGAGDLGGRRFDQPGAGLAVGAHEGGGHVGLEPVPRGGEAGEGDGADGRADGGDDVAGVIVLELLRGRALEVDVVAVA